MRNFARKDLSNTYFQFKQFKILQDQCAMKVCTDSCIQGALTAREVYQLQPENVLDIGAGTGLLSLMMAQYYKPQHQHAIEINKAAYEQACQNVDSSSFSDQINIFHGDARSFTFPVKYDFIVCNPPFYEGALKSPSASINQAMHTSDLNYTELIDSIRHNLKEQGHFSVMVPDAFRDSFIYKAAEKGFHPYKIWSVKNSEKHDFFRSILFFQEKQHIPEVQELIVKDDTGAYSPAFTDLLESYYLHL